MSLLSTLRPLSSRLQGRFWWILANLTVPGEVATTFTDLNDDVLLLLLEYLPLPDLLALRAVSRHLNEIISRYRLPQYRTLLYGYTNGEERQRYVEQVSFAHLQVKMYVSTQLHAYSEFNLPRRLSTCGHSPFFSRPRRLFPGQLHLLPLSLPSLLPNLASLTFSRFLEHSDEPLSEEEYTVNGLLANYLSSSWKETLVSLYLYIHVPRRPQPDTEFFIQIGKLPAMKYLNLEFSRYVAQEPATCSLLPDSLPVLSQLTSFSLANYGGRNTAALLAQLGPDLSYLSLWDIACSVEEYAAFLASKPTYSQTLKRVEILLHKPLYWRIFTVTAQHLLSLERAVLTFPSRHTPLDPFFANLNRLTHLRELSVVSISLDQLQALHELHPNRDTLPRVTTIRRLALQLYSDDAAFEASRLLDRLLPLLGIVFSRIEYLDLVYSQCRPRGPFCEALSVQLLARANKCFKGLSQCNARYYCPQ